MKVFPQTRIPNATLHLFLLLFGLCYFINIFTGDALTRLFALSPAKIAMSQWWRVLTYPFAIRNFIEMLIIGIVFYLFGMEIEQRLGRRKLLGAIGSIVLLQGVLYALLIPSGGRSLESSISLALAFLTFYTLQHHSMLTSFFGWFSLRQRFLWLLLVCLSIIPLFSLLSAPLLFLQSVFLLHGFGIFAGFILWRLETAPPQRRYQRAEEYSQLSPADEEELNALLDKIAEHGYKSLSFREKRRLKQLSSKL